jgi:hypothetical protein
VCLFRTTVRKIITSSILSTDMAKHFELQSKLDALDGTLGTLDKENFEQRQLLLGILVHASDISHPVRTTRHQPSSIRLLFILPFLSSQRNCQVFPFDLSFKFSTLVRAEFTSQARNERSRGLEPLPFMEETEETKVAKNEHGFISFVAAPIWHKIFSMYPELTAQKKNIEDNMTVWKRIADGEEQFPDETPGQKILERLSRLKQNQLLEKQREDKELEQASLAASTVDMVVRVRLGADKHGRKVILHSEASLKHDTDQMPASLHSPF